MKIELTEREKKIAELFAEMDIINANIQFNKELSLYFPRTAKRKLVEWEIKRAEVEKEIIELTTTNQDTNGF